MRDTKLTSPQKQNKTKQNKREKEVPRLTLLEEAIHHFIGKQENIDKRAKTNRDVSLLKNLFFKER